MVLKGTNLRTTRVRKRVISRGFSLYLDGVRAFAALVVLASHFAYARFTGGDYLIVRDLNLGSDAVVLFFVISGFVIAFTTDTKDRTWKLFAFHRATRLYSVAVPAIALTLLFDAVGSWANPAAYDGWWHDKDSLVSAVFASILFANEWGPLGLRLGTNGPYWSLSYEGAYYILFGLAFYLGGRRRLVLSALASLIVGPKVLVLIPSWIFGVVAYRRLAASERRRDGWRQSVMLAGALGSILLYTVCLAVDLPKMLLSLSTVLLGTAAINDLRFSDEFLWNAIIGALFASHLYAAGRLLQQTGDASRVARPVRWLAGASFSIYLVHYPALQLVDAFLPATPGLGRDSALLVATIVICFVFAQVFERPLATVRSRLLRWSRIVQLGG